jgi:hypothetical protein
VKIRQPTRPALSVVPRQHAANAIVQRLAQERGAAVGRPPIYKDSSARYGQGAGPALLGVEPTPVRQPGGDVVNAIVHPSITVFDRLYRKLPQQGFFSSQISGESPVEFELGAFEVPEGTEFWMFDYEFSVFRPSGQDPGDVIQAERSRFSGFMGFDLTFNGTRLADLSYELDPSAITASRDAFQQPPGVGQPAPNAYGAATVNSFASTASPGLSLLPVRDNVMGARNSPFSLVSGETSRVAASCVIFRQITAPLAFIQATIAGYLVQNQTSSALINRIRPQ